MVLPATPPHLTDDEHSDVDEQLQPVVAQPQQAPPVHQMTTRAKAGIIKPNPKYVMFTVKDEFAEPKSVIAALKHPGWNGAMGVEIDNMKEIDTFELVRPSDDQHPLSLQWVYKKKLDAKGNILK